MDLSPKTERIKTTSRPDAKKHLETRIIVIISCIIGLLFRLAYCIWFPVQPRDAYIYSHLISQWESTGRILDPIGIFPLSLWILKIPNHFFQYDVIKGAVLVNLLLGLTLIAIMQKIIMRFFKENMIILLTGLIIATHPVLVRISCSCLRENTYLFFLLLSLDSLLGYIMQRKMFYLLSSSALGAIAFMCRLEGAETLFFIFFTLFSLCLFRKITFVKAIKCCIVCLLVYAMTILGTYYSLRFDELKIQVNLMAQKINFEGI